VSLVPLLGVRGETPGDKLLGKTRKASKHTPATS